jgi:hypothetical protein
VYSSVVTLDFAVDPTSMLGRVVWEDVYGEVASRYSIYTAKTPPTAAEFVNLINASCNFYMAVRTLDNITEFKADVPVQPLISMRNKIVRNAEYITARTTTYAEALTYLVLPPKLVGLMNSLSNITDMGNRSVSFYQTPALNDLDNISNTVETLYQSVRTEYGRLRELARLMPEWQGVNTEGLDHGDEMFLWINGPFNNSAFTSFYPRTDPSGSTLRLYVPEGTSQKVLSAQSFYDLNATAWSYGYIQPVVGDTPHKYWDNDGVIQSVNDGYEARYLRKPLAYTGYTYEFDVEQSVIFATTTLISKRNAAARDMWDIFRA